MDSILKQNLRDGGVNVDEAMERVMGNEALLKKLLLRFASDTNFSILETALSENDTEQAFRAAHTLKGIAGTLSLTSLYRIISEMTELLRYDNIEQAKNKFPELAISYNTIIEMIKNL